MIAAAVTLHTGGVEHGVLNGDKHPGIHTPYIEMDVSVTSLYRLDGSECGDTLAQAVDDTKLDA